MKSKLLNLEALNEIEKDRLDCFVRKHKKHNVTSNGTNFTFEISPNTIGTVIMIRCSCGEEKNLTDYSCW